MELNYKYAKTSQRIIAAFVDGIIFSLLFYAIIKLVLWGFGKNLDELLDFGQPNLFKVGYKQISTLCFIFYGTIFESSKYQGTPGKGVAEIKVVDKNNKRLSFKDAFMRNAFKPISTLLFFIGHFWMIFDKKKQALHDKIGNSYVVEEQMTY